MKMSIFRAAKFSSRLTLKLLIFMNKAIIRPGKMTLHTLHMKAMLLINII